MTHKSLSSLRWLSAGLWLSGLALTLSFDASMLSTSVTGVGSTLHAAAPQALFPALDFPMGLLGQFVVGVVLLLAGLAVHLVYVVHRDGSKKRGDWLHVFIRNFEELLDRPLRR